MTTKQRTIKPAEPTTDRFEVLTENQLGQRTVHRVTATSAKDAEDQVRESIPDTHKVLETGKAGEGIGSGDRDTPGGGYPS